MHKGFFLYDVIAVLPLDYMMYAAGVDLQIIAFVRILRFFKIFRVLEIMKILRSIFDVSLTEYSIITSIYFIIILAHFVACLFFWMGNYEYQSDNRFDGKNLYEDIVSRPFLHYDSVLEMGVAESYLHFLYFGMGYAVNILAGDMIPYGHVEEAIRRQLIEVMPNMVRDQLMWFEKLKM